MHKLCLRPGQQEIIITNFVLSQVNEGRQSRIACGSTNVKQMHFIDNVLCISQEIVLCSIIWTIVVPVFHKQHIWTARGKLRYICVRTAANKSQELFTSADAQSA